MADDELALKKENLPTEQDYEMIAARLKDGALVPFFGSGASLGCGALPSAQELAKLIADEAKFPEPAEQNNLALVASYLVQISSDSIGLETLLRKVFDVPADPTPLHDCIASSDKLRLVVTTNYDDLIERALEARWLQTNSEARKPWIVIDRGVPGIVWYRQPGGPLAEAQAASLRDVLFNPESAPGQQPLYRPILFKMHGSLDRLDRDQDWYLITEEHYVDFLGRPDTGQIPPQLMRLLIDRSFLFLGYGLRDWNVRVLLRKIMLSRNQSKRIKSWAVVKSASVAEKRLWASHGIEIFEIDLQTFAQELKKRL
jgi:hypothetical protein